MRSRTLMSGTRLLGRAGVVAFLVVASGLAGCSGNDGPARGNPSAASSGDSVALARCMRSNGVPNFPDPDPNGGIALDPKKGLDPNSAAFKAAEDKCRQFMPTSGSSGGNGADSWSMADKLNYAKCMRQSGVPSFPDPDSNGQFPAFDSGSGIDPLSPRFKQAEETCVKYQPKNMPKRTAAPGGGS
jgi:hypothetical protein